MRLLIYGLGKEALLAVKAVRKEHTVVGFTDSFADIKSYAGFDFYNRKVLKNVCFDCIVLALSNRNISEEVKEELIRGGIGAQKIVDFIQLFTRQKVDKVMGKCKGEKIDGLILGMSHALWGINPSYLSGAWRNLAMPGEDLYYYFKVLSKCVDVYSDAISDLKYAIIDLYDYTMFDYDLSLSKNILFYWSFGGYAEDTHHFNKNKKYIGNVEEEMRKIGSYMPVIAENEFQLAERLFDGCIAERGMDELSLDKCVGDDGFRDYPLREKLNKIIPEEPCFPYDLHYSLKRHPDTVEENKAILQELIKLLKQINPKIKIYFILIPRFGKLEKYHAVLLKQMKEEFEAVMGNICRIKDFYYRNFKNYREINENRYFFWDDAHLNYMGAIAFTEILNKWIGETIFDK